MRSAVVAELRQAIEDTVHGNLDKSNSKLFGMGYTRSYGRKIYELQSRRHVSDYDDYAVIPRDELAGHIEFSKDILKDIEAYCRRRAGEEIWQKLYGGIARTYLEESSE